MRGIVTEPVGWLTVHSNAVQCLQLGLLCLAPAYLIFTPAGAAGASVQLGMGDHRRAGAASGELGCTTVSDRFSSRDYTAHWLPSMIYDYGSVRFEIGTACALMLLTLLLYAAVVAAGHLLVWAVSRLFRACGALAAAGHPVRAVHWGESRVWRAVCCCCSRHIS